MSMSHARFVDSAVAARLPSRHAGGGAAACGLFLQHRDPDGKMATASRPDSDGKFEIETGDDFVLTTTTWITSATFTGLLTGDGSVGNVRVEIYRVFPNNSDVGRTSGPPTFST